MQSTPANCQDEFDPNAKTVQQALDYIKEQVTPVTEIISLPIEQAYGHVLAEPVHSTLDVPAYTNSAMDGYGLKGDRLDQPKQTYTIIGKVFAGSPFDGEVRTGECVRIMTGAPIPPGVDTVVMQEHTEQCDESQIQLIGNHSVGQNVRHAGEDVKKHDVVFTQGWQLKAADIGVLASLGYQQVSVFRKLRVAVISTGDELRNPGDKLAAGQIYDSNRFSLMALLQQNNIEARDFGIIPDVLEQIRMAMDEAAHWADIVVTSGGVSVGEADFIKQILDEIGQVNFWKIAMKPGRPLAYGKIHQAEFFGLPGNPVSAMATFIQFLRPALVIKSGASHQPVLELKLQTASSLKKKPGRVDYQRGVIYTNEQGQSVVRSTGQQGSHILSSMSQANCFIVLPLESSGVDAGEWVTVQPFFTL